MNTKHNVQDIQPRGRNQGLEGHHFKIKPFIGPEEHKYYNNRQAKNNYVII
ncbi:hypothetical protein HmCmsJML300_04213 [Escherichia coli]|nr:hypothetical protein HmCmsJML300_04213 [Escherichia coli]GDF08459.1 hypothetical protein HmCmsJML296_03118 [Escherichia coli]